MKMTFEQLKLNATDRFQDVEVDFFQDNEGEFVFTREQIGRALGYSEPNKAVAKIQERNPDRFLDKATIVKMTNVEGNRVVTRDVWVYNRKGVMEICRHSKQPLADAFMDWVWDKIDELMKKGYATVESMTMEATVPPMSVVFKNLALWIEKQEKENAERDQLIAENSREISGVKRELAGSLRSQFKEAVSECAALSGRHPARIYRTVYKTLGRQAGVDILMSAREWKVKPIDVVEKMDLYAQAIKLARWIASKSVA